MAAQDIILRPVLSEKSYEGIPKKIYTFVVRKDANKTEIKLAVEELFKVNVASVNTVNVSGRYKRVGRSEGYTSDYKKAIVRLTDKSKSIAFFDSLQ